MSKRARRAVAIMVIGLALVGTCAGRGYLLPAVARWLDVGQPVRPADYAMVLPGNQNTRPFATAALFKAGLAPQILVTQAVPSPEVRGGIVPAMHEIIRDAMASRGVPLHRITVLNSESSSTFDDIQALARFLESSPGARVLIITDDYHTRRARWVAARILGDRLAQVSFVSAPTDEFRPDNWWQSDLGFLTIVGEYLKFAYYVARYGTFLYWAIPGAVLTMVVVIYRRFRRRAGSDAPGAQQEATSAV